MNQSVFSIDSLLFLCPSVVAASVPSSSCWIFYRVWKAIQWNHRREGEDVAGVLPPLTSPHLRDALQHLSAGRARPLFKSRSCPSNVPMTPIVCRSPPIQSRAGELSLMKAGCQGLQSRPLLPFQVGGTEGKWSRHGSTWRRCRCEGRKQQRNKGGAELHLHHLTREDGKDSSGHLW